jgi:OOP family OmpA-OmpF porin
VFTQRFANRNKYAMIDTKLVYFDFNKSDIRDEGMAELDDVARALKADPNAVLELQGFADQRGTDRYNYQLTRDRVDAVVRYLVQRHGIDLRRIHAVGMGKATLEAGQKGNKETFAKSRRVEMRLLSPQS